MPTLHPILSAASAMAAAAWLALSATAAQAIDIKPVSGKSGVTAWLVEDYTTPVITLAASFRGGTAQDPPGKEGLAALMSSLFDEGAGPYDSKEFQARLEQLGVTLRYRDQRDGFTVVLRSLRSDRDEAIRMMRLSLTDLHYEDGSIERMRNALKAQLLRDQNSGTSKAGQALRESLFGDHAYAQPSDGTMEGLDSIGRTDLVAHFSRLFARDNVTVGIVGAISPREAADLLDTVFGDLPEKAELRAIPDIEPKTGAVIHVEENTPQATVAMALPGVPRDSKRFFAAYLMNHILGGGSFSSRLYEEVREKRGLAYSVSSSLTNYDHTAFLTIGLATRSDRADQTIALMRREIERMAREGPTEAELEAAKKYVIGSYAINNLDTSAKVARALVSIQEENLGIDYMQTREEKINSVTLEEVRAVARELLSAEPTIVVVGPGNS